MSLRLSRRRARVALVLPMALAMAMAIAGCAGDAPAVREGPGVTGAVIGGAAGAPGAPAATRAPTTTVYAPTTTAPPADLATTSQPTCPGSVDDATFRPAAVGRAPSTTELEASPSTPTTPAVPTTAAPRDAAGAIDDLRRDPRLAGTTISASVWLEGRGETASENPDKLVIPASNEKLVTGIGAFNLLDLDEQLHTDLVATGPIDDGVLHGDLVLVGGGDPVLTRVGPDSLDELARRASEAGLRRVEGRLLVDESRYDTIRVGQNWPSDWLESIGPMSSLGVDHNMITKDATYVADPAIGNGAVMRFGLGAHGITVVGAIEHGHADEGVRLVGVDSPPIRDLLAMMLTNSDNFIAELLTKEIGLRQTHQRGATAAGLAAIHQVITNLCVPIAGLTFDGSGLSRDDRRSARELRRLLQIAEVQPWGGDFVSSLSIAGEKDALAGRLAGPATAGKLRAKGGFLFASKSLSGYLTTADGRQAVFSVIVNGDLSSPRNKADFAIDDFVTNIASLST